MKLQNFKHLLTSVYIYETSIQLIASFDTFLNIVHVHRSLTFATLHYRSPIVLHLLLDLVEFMERSEKALPLDITKLGYLAHKSHAYAKALYYMVLHFTLKLISPVLIWLTT